MNATQINLINAAEQEFAERGYHGASIRDITKSAGANVAAVNYHFGSKESLFIEMIRYRVQPINDLRMELLKQALAENDGEPLPFRKIVDILVRPLVEVYLQRSEESTNQHFMRAMGRGLAEESQFMARLYQDVFADLLRTFRNELARSLPDLPDERINTCFAYLGSTISGVMQRQHKAAHVNENNFLPDANALVLFISGGIEALVTDYRDNRK